MVVITGIFQLYYDVFLQFMIVRFAKEAQKGQVIDKVLGKAVPSVVAIQNTKLLKKTIQEDIRLNKEQL